MCSTPLKRDCNHRCDHWPFAIVTTGVTTDHWPFTIVTTDLSLYSQFTLCSLTQETDWYNTSCDSSFIPLHGEIIQKFLLVSPLPYPLSLLSDWSACAHTYPPGSLIGQSKWAHAALPTLWLVSLNEHMLLCEWACNYGEIQWKIKTDTDTHTHTHTHLHPLS